MSKADTLTQRHGWHHLQQRTELSVNRLQRSVRQRIGLRGETLATAGLLVILLGYGYATAPVPRLPGTHVLHDLIPSPWWGVAWIVTGAIGMSFALARKPGRDRIGYAALILMPSLQAASYVTSWALVYFGQPNDPRGIFSALPFIVLARFIAICARSPEPPLAALTPRGDR